MRIFLIGGTGLVGSYLLPRLIEKGHKVYTLTRDEGKIFNDENKTPIGKISYNSWMTKAKIECAGKVYYWKYDNSWSTKWSLNNAEGSLISYTCSTAKGGITYDLQNNLLVLTGLYIKNYYWQFSVVFLISAFVPLWSIIFN
jgi:NAD dependent epimerase/dehydratase family